MEELELFGWRVACDPDATRRATGRMPGGAAEACGCDACRAYAERRLVLLPAELVETLGRLGCAPDREVEVALLGHAPRPAGEWRVRAAWRFVGRVLSGPHGVEGARFAADPGGAGLARLELELAVPEPPPSPRNSR